MSGTLYNDRSGRSVAKGGEIIMEDREGNIISITSNEAGNIWTKAPFASDPYTIGSYHGGPPFEPLYKEDSEGNLLQPADPNDSRTWKYKTWGPKRLLRAADGDDPGSGWRCSRAPNEL